MNRTLFPALAVVAVAAISAGALAGPPLICHPIEIGDAKSLPWGDQAFKKSGSYDTDRVIDDTLAILRSDTPVLVRMETIRRASLYLEDDVDQATALLNALMARALDAEAADRKDAGAWFDAGYLVQAYHQLDPKRDGWPELGVADGVAGYGWVRRAIELQPDDPSLEFAAALVSVMAPQPVAATHLEKARKMAKPDTLLASNIEKHAPIIGEISRTSRR